MHLWAIFIPQASTFYIPGSPTNKLRPETSLLTTEKPALVFAPLTQGLGLSSGVNPTDREGISLCCHGPLLSKFQKLPGSSFVRGKEEVQ